MRNLGIVITLMLLVFAFSCPARGQSSGDGRVRFPIEGDCDPLPIDHQFPFLAPPGVPARPSLNRKSIPTEEPASADNASSRLPLMYPSGITDNDPDDPDTSPELRESWKVWHRHVAETFQLRFNELAKRAFSQSKTPPLNCEAAFTISNMRKIVSIKIGRASCRERVCQYV